MPNQEFKFISYEGNSSYIEYLMDLMILNNSSDLYLTFSEPPCLRIYNKIHRIIQLPKLNEEKLIEIRNSLVSKYESPLLERQLNLDIGRSYKTRRFRINISRQQNQFMVVCRLLEEKIKTIAELGFSPVLKDLTHRGSGIILLSGPTGSGKSTTLAGMIEEINRDFSKHIITIEDPIEYIFDPINCIIEQKQLGVDILSFASALKFALRQRPDVILFGEMRDNESIQNAITLAETGHLILSTIHSRSCSQTINKIIDSFPPNQQSQIKIQLSETLLAVIGQRILRRKDGQGLVVAQEIMLNNTAVSNLIRENQTKQINNVITTNRQIGMKLLEEDLIELIMHNIISIPVALNAANNPEYIKSELENRGIYMEEGKEI